MYNTTSTPNTSMLQAPPVLDRDVRDLINKHKQEEQETHLAPKIMPFSLDSINEHIYKVYAPLIDLRDLLIATKNEPKRNKPALDEAIKLIDKIQEELIFTLPAILAKQEI